MVKDTTVKKKKKKVNETLSVKMKKPKKAKIDLIALGKQSSNVPIEVPPYQLVNVVATCNLGLENIDLRSLALNHSFC